MVPGNPVTAIANEKTPSGVIDKVCEFGLQLLKVRRDLGPEWIHRLLYSGPLRSSQLWHHS